MNKSVLCGDEKSEVPVERPHALRCLEMALTPPNKRSRLSLKQGTGNRGIGTGNGEWEWGIY